MEVRLLTCPSKDEIFQSLKEGKPLNLSNCYIKDFSLTEYRKSLGLAISDYVVIKDLLARDSFFDNSGIIDFSYSDFSGSELNFNGSVFAGRSLSFFHSKANTELIDFARTSYACGDVNFQYAQLKSSVITFRSAFFNTRLLSFVNANFASVIVDFSRIDFSRSDIAFQFARFSKGVVNFSNSIFGGGRIDFSRVEFDGGKVDFRRCSFGDGEISFSECELFNGKLLFRRSKFGGGKISFEMAHLDGSEISFGRCDFSPGELSFYRCNCALADFKSAHINNFLDLRFKSCQEVDLSGAVLRDMIDFTNERGKVNIRCIDFSGIRNLGRIMIDWYDNRVPELVHQQLNTTLRSKAEQFRMLKEEFRAQGKYADEDLAYIEFKRIELRDRRSRVNKSNWFNALWSYPFSWIEYFIFDFLGHYATNPLRVLISMLIVYVSFSLTYAGFIWTGYADILPAIPGMEPLPLVARSFYHSAVTFLTIGYGDYYPSGILRALSAIEGFFGLFLLAYFTVAFVRKILR